jgi:hypothetical protein
VVTLSEDAWLVVTVPTKLCFCANLMYTWECVYFLHPVGNASRHPTHHGLNSTPTLNRRPLLPSIFILHCHPVVGRNWIFAFWMLPFTCRFLLPWEPRLFGRYGDGLRAGRAGARDFFFIFPGLKRPRREGDLSIPSKCRGQEWWSYTATPPYVFMMDAQLHTGTTLFLYPYRP